MTCAWHLHATPINITKLVNMNLSTTTPIQRVSVKSVGCTPFGVGRRRFLGAFVGMLVDLFLRPLLRFAIDEEVALLIWGVIVVLVKTDRIGEVIVACLLYRGQLAWWAECILAAREGCDCLQRRIETKAAANQRY